MPDHDGMVSNIDATRASDGQFLMRLHKKASDGLNDSSFNITDRLGNI